MRSVLDSRPNAPAFALTVTLALASFVAPAWASVRSEVAFHRGVAAFGEGRLFEAEREFQTVIEENPEDTAALSYLGLIAQGEGETDTAIGYFERVLAVDPGDAEARLQLATVLLEAGRDVEADVQLGTVRAKRPGDAYVLHYSGVAAYRAGRYEEAIRYFESAVERDPELRLQGRYYIGLCETFLRDSEAALGAFASVEEESPSHPLARSAAELQSAMRGPEPRRWGLAATTGIEYDSNPLGIGDLEAGSGAAIDDDGDVRGVFRLAAQARAMDEPFRLLFGYDGYLSLHADQSRVNQQTQLLWAGASVPLGPVRVGLRGDASWSAIGLDETFRWLYRLIPTVTLATGDWGVGQLYYEFQYNDFRNTGTIPDPVLRAVLDRDGPRHTLGFDQFAFFEGVLSALRAGAAYTQYDPEGDEFEHAGFEVSAGGTLGLGPVELRTLYRFQYRDYRNITSPRLSSKGVRREDRAHRVVLDLVIPITKQLDAVVFGRLSFNGSNIGLYRYDRQVGGLNLTYRF